MSDPLQKLTTRDIIEMQRGEHSSQKKKSFSMYSPPKAKEIPREVGEEWDELDENGEVICRWKQHDGYRAKVITDDETHFSWKELYDYPNCEATCEKKNSKTPGRYTRLDKKYRQIYGMCTECAANYETRLKMSGSWKEFERTKMLANAQSFFHEMDDAVRQTAERVEKVEFVNEDGSVADWEGSKERADQLRKEYETYKTLILETLEGKRDDIIVK